MNINNYILKEVGDLKGIESENLGSMQWNLHITDWNKANVFSIKERCQLYGGVIVLESTTTSLTTRILLTKSLNINRKR